LRAPGPPEAQVLQKRPVTLIVGIVLMIIAIALMLATLS
jgi:hypothetical protein